VIKVNQEEGGSVAKAVRSKKPPKMNLSKRLVIVETDIEEIVGTTS
jgi:hypothetical protein